MPRAGKGTGADATGDRTVRGPQGSRCHRHGFLLVNAILDLRFPEKHCAAQLLLLSCQGTTRMCDVTSPAGRKAGGVAETDGLMRSDAEIRNDVIDELRWDPQIPEPDAIGVAVTDGAVTLTGHVATYAQKLAAVRAAERVEGVKAVANEIKVELAGMGRDDADIAAAIARILDWDVQIPEGAVHARVENGWVIMAGEVEYDFQRREVERMVRQVRG